MLSDISRKRVLRTLQLERRRSPRTFNHVSRLLCKLEGNVEFDALFESIHDGLYADFKLWPEFFFVVQRRSHVRDGSGEIVVGGVNVREQSGRGRHVSHRRNLRGLQSTRTYRRSPLKYSSLFFAS